MTALPEPRPVAEYHGVGRDRFRDEIRPLGQPAVLRGLASHWPAVEAARASPRGLTDYLRRFGTDRPVAAIVGPPEIQGRLFYRDDFAGLNFSQQRATLGQFLEKLEQERENPRPPALALQSAPITELLPGFGDENGIDLLHPGIVPRAWIGNKVRVVPHFDVMENIGCVVAGRRRFTLFPPEQIANLYVGPFELTPAGAPVSLVDPQAPDLERFPRYAEAAAAAQSAVLEPGDAIYIPYQWWHGVDSLEPVNLFVNYWWNPAPCGLGGAFDALLHALYSLRNLPPDQRDVWRAFFDHYVFAPHENAAAHIPEQAQGVLGTPTRERLEAMRTMLRQTLERRR